MDDKLRTLLAGRFIPTSFSQEEVKTSFRENAVKSFGEAGKTVFAWHDSLDHDTQNTITPRSLELIMQNYSDHLLQKSNSPINKEWFINSDVTSSHLDSFVSFLSQYEKSPSIQDVLTSSLSIIKLSPEQAKENFKEYALEKHKEAALPILAWYDSLDAEKQNMITPRSLDLMMANYSVLKKDNLAINQNFLLGSRLPSEHLESIASSLSSFLTQYEKSQPVNDVLNKIKSKREPSEITTPENKKTI